MSSFTIRNILPLTSRICRLIVIVMLIPTGGRADQPQARFDDERRRLDSYDDTDTAWMINAFARVRLTDGTAIHTSDDRYEVAVREDAGQTVLEFSDKHRVLDLTWTVEMLDGRSATARLKRHNRGAKSLRLRQFKMPGGGLWQGSGAVVAYKWDLLLRSIVFAKVPGFAVRFQLSFWITTYAQPKTS